MLQKLENRYFYRTQTCTFTLVCLIGDKLKPPLNVFPLSYQQNMAEIVLLKVGRICSCSGNQCLQSEQRLVIQICIAMGAEAYKDFCLRRICREKEPENFGTRGDFHLNELEIQELNTLI